MSVKRSFPRAWFKTTHKIMIQATLTSFPILKEKKESVTLSLYKFHHQHNNTVLYKSTLHNSSGQVEPIKFGISLKFDHCSYLCSLYLTVAF